MMEKQDWVEELQLAKEVAPEAGASDGDVGGECAAARFTKATSAGTVVWWGEDDYYADSATWVREPPEPRQPHAAGLSDLEATLVNTYVEVPVAELAAALDAACRAGRGSAKLVHLHAGLKALTTQRDTLSLSLSEWSWLIEAGRGA